MREKLTSPGGVEIDWYGPSAAEVRAALSKAGHAKATKPKTPGGLPGVGFVVAKPRQVAYVEVSAAMRGLIERYRTTLTAAGFVVEDDSHRPGKLVVFSPAKKA